MTKVPKKSIKVSVFLLGYMLSFTGMAEYRAYQYIIKSKIRSESAEYRTSSKIINSTLNPVSFIAYNGGFEIIEIDLINSWMCPGNTSKKKICNPISQDNNGN